MTEDEEIVRRVLAGESDAYAVLVRKYQDRVRGHCYHMLRRDPDDASQEVFIKAYKALKNFRGDSTFSTWLYRIVVNHCKDVLRKKRFPSTDDIDRMSTPAKVAIPVEEAELLRRILSELPEDYRIVLLLKEYHQLRYAEIAETLGTTTDSVRAKLRRARAQAIQIQERLTQPNREEARQ